MTRWLAAARSLLYGSVFLGAHLFVRFREEPKLEERFGEEYRAYRERVNRWVPRPPAGGDG